MQVLQGYHTSITLHMTDRMVGDLMILVYPRLELLAALPQAVENQHENGEADERDDHHHRVVTAA